MLNQDHRHQHLCLDQLHPFHLVVPFHPSNQEDDLQSMSTLALDLPEVLRKFKAESIKVIT